MNATTYKITGSDAFRLAERDQLTIHTHANPVDVGGPVTLGVARQILKDDPSLLYVIVVPDGWWQGRRLGLLEGYNVSDYFTPDGTYLGPDDEGTEPTWNDSDATTNTTEALREKANQLHYELIYDNGLVAVQPQQFDREGVRQVTTRPDPRDFKSEEAALTSLFESQFEAIASKGAR